MDHCANYRRPKSDEKDEHGNRKEIIEEGCAPKTPSPSPPASDEEENYWSCQRKGKKRRKQRNKRNAKMRKHKIKRKERSAQTMKIPQRKGKSLKRSR